MVLSKDLGDGFGYFDITGDSTLGLADILNVSDVSDVRVGQLIISPDFPAGTRVSSIVLPDTVIADQVATASTVGVAIRVADYIEVSGEVYFASDVNDYPNNYFSSQYTHRRHRDFIHQRAQLNIKYVQRLLFRNRNP
jgi:hypothetical protein